MKFSQKIFLLSFVLMTVTSIIIGILVINVSHNNNKEQEIQINIKEHNRILNLIYTKLEEIEDSRNTAIDYNNQYVSGYSIVPAQNISDILYDISNLYRDYLGNTKMYLYVYDNCLYRDDYALEKELLNEVYPQGEEIYTYIDKKNLFISSKFKIEDLDYNLITKKDISYIYELKENMITNFQKISILVTMVGAVISFIISYFMTKKVEKLNEVTKEIAKGNYKTIEIKGKDEIATLSQNFNFMSEAIKKDFEDIKRVAKARETFINNYTHEIRTPLTSMVIFSDTLKNKKQLDEKLKEEYLDIIYEEANYISNVGNKMMDLILLDNREVTLKYINISDVLKETCNVMSKSLKVKRITIKTNIEKDVIIKSDKELIKILISNLIRNSAKAYSGMKGIIEVYLDQKHIKVVDFGCGIPDDKLEEIMKPFVSLEDRDKELGGMGLGLPLCKKIAEIHKGDFKIFNHKNGVIAEFYFEVEEAK